MSKEEKKKWQAQSQKNVLVKKTMEAIGWEYVSLHYIMYILTFFKVTYNIFGLFAAFFSKGSIKPIEQRGATEKSLEGSKSKQYTSQKDLGGYWLGICESTSNKKNCLSKFLILIN